MPEIAVEEYLRAERTVTMTNEQWSTLVCYILMTTQHRKRERESWEAMVNDKYHDGTPLFPHAAENARYYAELDDKLEEIKKRIEEVRL